MAKCASQKKKIRTARTPRARGKALAAYNKCKRGAKGKRGKFHYEFSSDLEKCFRVSNKTGHKAKAADKHCVRSHTIKSRRRRKTWPPTV